MARLLTLGRFELREDGAGAGAPTGTQPKRLALLTYFALATPRGLHRRDALVALFWPDSGTDEARNALRQALHHLRQYLGDGGLETRSDDRVGLAPGGVACDALEFEAAVAAGDDARAVRLYEGPFLDAVFVRGVSPEFEEWAHRLRTRLRREAAEAAGRLAEQEWVAGRVEGAVAAARRRTEIDPESEEALRALLGVLHDAGRTVEALAVAERFRVQLQQEHELEWSAETAALVASIQGGTRVRRAAPVVPAVRSTTAASAGAVAPAETTPESAIAATTSGATTPVPEAGRASVTPSAPRRPAASRPTGLDRLLLIGALLAAVAGVFAWRAWAARRGGDAPRVERAARPVQRVLVTDFVERPSPRGLGALVASAIRVDLAQSPMLRVLTTAQVSATLKLLSQPVEVSIDDSLAREIAIREGAAGFVMGEVHVVGGQVMLAARLVASPSGDEMAAARETARDSADLLPAIERLSRSLRHRIGEELSQVNESVPLTRVATSSLEALQRYSDGLRQLDLGNRAEGVQLLEQAVAIDTGFATAYRMLGSTYSSLGEPARATAALTQAFRHRLRLPFKERYLVMGSYHRNVTGDYTQAADAYRRLLALYPDDLAGQNNLGLTLTSLGQYAPAESLFRRVRAQDSTITSVWLVLAEALVMQGRVAEADEVLAEVERRFPDHPVARLTRIYVPAAASDWPRARLRAAERLAKVTATTDRIDALQTLGQIEVLMGEVTSGEARLRESMRLAQRDDSPWKYLWSATVLAMVELRHRQDTSAARAQLRQALATIARGKLDSDNVPTPQLVDALVAAGMVREARAFLPATADTSTRPPDVANRRYLEGRVAAGEGRWNEAVVALRASASVPSACPICGLAELAAAEEGAGQLRAALATAERYVSTPFIHRFEPDAVQLAETWRRIARLRGSLGDSAGANDAAARLRALWREADPALVSRLRATVPDDPNVARGSGAARPRD